MRSKTSYFSRTIFLNTLKRFWPLFAAYLVIWLLIVPLPLNAMLSNAAEYGRDGASDAASQIMDSGLYGGALMSIVFSALFAMAAFYYLYNNRSTSQMCSLPVRREGVFLSVFLPGLAVMLASNLITFLMSIVVAASYGVSIAGYAMQAFAMVCLMNLFFYGFAAFCAMLTGHVLVLPAVYIVLNLAVAGAVFLVYSVLDKFVYGISLSLYSNIPLFFMSPIVYILAKTRIVWLNDYKVDYEPTGFAYDGWTYLIVAAVAGIVFAGLAILLLKRRRMETSGDVVAIRPLKPVFKYCLTAACALGAGVGLHYLIYPYNYTSVGFEGMITVLGLMLFGAFVGYFAAEMLMQKTFRVFFPGKWKGFGASALIIIALTLVCEFDITGFERNVPASGDVKAVVLYGLSSPAEATDAEDIRTVIDIHESIVKNKARHENGGDNYGYFTVYIEYAMKDGSFMHRRYYLSTESSEDAIRLQDFLNTPRMILERNDPGVTFSEKTMYDANVSVYDPVQEYHIGNPLTSEEAFELYTECILPDMKDGSIGLIRLGFGDDDTSGDIFMACEISFNLNELMPDGEYRHGYMYFTPTTSSVRTNEWLTEHGFELLTHAEIGEPVYYK